MQSGSFDVRQTALGNKFSQATGINMNTGSGLLKTATFGGLALSAEDAAGGREGRQLRAKEQLDKNASYFLPDKKAQEAIEFQKEKLAKGDDDKTLPDKVKNPNNDAAEIANPQKISADDLKKNLESSRESVEKLDSQITKMKESNSNAKLLKDPNYQKLVSERNDKKGEVTVYQKETSRRETEKGKLETLAKHAEKSGANQYYASKMKESGYHVHGAKTEIIKGPKDKDGKETEAKVITSLGHLDFKTKDLDQKAKNMGEAVIKDFARGAALGLMVGGVPGALVGGAFAARGGIHGLASYFSKDMDARAINDATHVHTGDHAGGHGHGGGFKSYYQGPTSNMFGNIFSAPKAQAHAPAGDHHDDHAHH